MIWLAGYVLTIFAANWLIVTFGLIGVGFGLTAPAGVLAAGLAFTFRDLTQESLGRWPTVAAIGAGALLSLAVAPPQLALASGLAFLVSETADMLVYTPLRRRNWLAAVAASNTVGVVIDSALFLALAFGSLAFLPGQVISKTYMTLLAVGVLWAVRRRHAALVAA